MPITPKLFRVYKKAPRNSRAARTNNGIQFAFGSENTDTNIILKIEEMGLDSRRDSGFGPTEQIITGRAVRNSQNNNIKLNHFVGTPVDNPATDEPVELWKVIDITRTSTEITLVMDKEDTEKL